LYEQVSKYAEGIVDNLLYGFYFILQLQGLPDDLLKANELHGLY